MPAKKITAKAVGGKREGKKVRTLASIPLKRFFTKAGISPFDEVKWVKRDAVVGSGEKKVFEQKDVEFPEFWSQNAVNITASKYFRGQLGTPDRERSARHMIERVVKVLRSWGEKNGYFVSAAQAQIFDDELTNLLVYQKGSFNSPVWFNVGSQPEPQCSACFILSAKDDMRDILDWIKTEGMIFKGGSGTGINLSNLRSKREQLSKGGYASGPVSFMRGADSVAGMIKSGGTTRRAAKMVVLDIDHPDMMDFIKVKAEEEKKVRALAAAGYNMADLNNEAWNSIQYQNANNSIRITDDFMEAVERDGDWQTRFRVSGKVADTYKAREVLDSIAQAAWECGDPGVQFDTIINKWHTCPNSGRINASNPCSEYMHLDDSACNLASINLLKFLNEDGTFDVKGFKQAVDVFILAQEIIVSGSYYPTEKITKNAKDFRELGLGFANLGALLMTKGLAYDSDEAQAWSGAIASLMSGEAYKMSAQIAARTGPFAGFAVNREPMLDVIKMHGEEAHKVNSALLGDKKLAAEAVRVWDEAHAEGERNGYRNSQVTVIAPTGTISFMMDCDTTGIEPAFSLVTMKQLVGGGWMKLVNAGIPLVLKRLGYESEEIKTIADHILATGTVEGAPGFKEEHLPIFDCAVRPASGTRSISWRGHVRIVGAVQPFISGAISKTFNMANDVTKEEIEEAYVMAWKLGIKAFAVYRDGSKGTQPLSTSEKKNEKKNEKGGDGATRHRLPVTRSSETHKFSIVGHDGYLTYSMYEDGALAEVFIRMSKQGSTLAGLLDAFAISVSMALQYGVPLKDLAHKFIYTRFEPAGFTENPEIRIATSIIDYIFRYLALRFLGPDELAEFGMNPSLEAHEEHNVKLEAPKTVVVEARPAHIESEANGGGESLYSAKQRTGTVLAETVCKKCGGMMVRTGTCMTCLQCGSSSGGCS